MRVGVLPWLLAATMMAAPGFTNELAAQNPAPLNNALLASHWKAEWIASPKVAVTAPGVFAFRKSITLAKVPEHYWVHVSADNRFLLHVNGAYVGEGPARGDLMHWRFESYDLAPFLKAGENVLAALVWNYADEAPVAQISSHTGFLMQGDTEAEAAANTDASWQVRTEKGRTTMGHNGLRDYYAAGPAERIDGRLLDWRWDAIESTAKDWAPARSLWHAATREAQDSPTIWELEQDRLPAMEHRAVSAGKLVRVDGAATAENTDAMRIPAHSHRVLLLDNAVLQTAYPELKLSAGKDAELKLTYSEALYDAQGQKGNRNEIEGRHIEGITDVLLADGGADRRYSPLWWRTWRYLQIDVTTQDEPLTIDSIGAWFSAYPFVKRAKIEAAIPQLDALVETGWRTARLCAHETYMDAPYWEQLQYVGDTRIQALVSYAMSGDARLARQAVTNIDNSRAIEGITESRYPSGLPQFIPTFSLLWVGMVHDYWMYVDDAALVKTVTPHTRTVLDWFTAHLRQDNLLGKMPWWEFADWTGQYPGGVPPQDADGGSTLLTLQYIAALRDAAELEEEFGQHETAVRYRTQAAKSSEALRKLNWNPATGLFNDTPQNHQPSKDANIMAVVLDVAPVSEQKAILEKLIAPTATTPKMTEPSYYFRFYLARAMEHAGLGDRYTEELKPWYGMLDLGLSTWAENPEPARSDCHAWSAAPNYDLLRIVAGIKPAEAGFKAVQIEPHLGTLTKLDATMPTPQGDLSVSYAVSSDKLTAKILLPEKMTGSIAWRKSTIKLHGGEQTVELR